MREGHFISGVACMTLKDFGRIVLVWITLLCYWNVSADLDEICARGEVGNAAGHNGQELLGFVL